MRAPLIVHWPAGLRQSRGLRKQFHHAIDLAPTLLELTGIEAPASYRGHEQIPVHGKSFAYTFHDEAAPSRRETQYFEMGGQRGIWHNGWKAVTCHVSGTDYDEDTWQLYDLTEDFSECVDRAAEHPALLGELVDLWWEEAIRNGVLPLDDRAQARAYARDPLADRRSHFRLLPGTRLLTPVTGPNWSARPFRILAETERRDRGEEGVLLAYGRRAAGFSLFVQANRLVFDYNLAGRHTVVTADAELPLGQHLLVCAVSAEGKEVRARLLVDDVEVGSGRLARLFPAGFGVMSTQCGCNSPSPVSRLYQAPFRFAGTIHRVEVELGPSGSDPAAAEWEAALKAE